MRKDFLVHSKGRSDASEMLWYTGCKGIFNALNKNTLKKLRDLGYLGFKSHSHH